MNYFVVDACFLANKYIPLEVAPPGNEWKRLSQCHAWRKEIQSQLDNRKARVYVPDVCIAETFKVLATKYYRDRWFKSAAAMNNARKRFRSDIVVPTRTLTAKSRVIKFHDLPTTRDIVISVDRFYEMFIKARKYVGVIDLILVAGAKYIMDFYDIPRDNLHIVTLDGPLAEGSRKIPEIPNAYNPTREADAAARVFD